MKGITFTVLSISTEGKEKLKLLEDKRKEKLRKLVEDYRKNIQF